MKRYRGWLINGIVLALIVTTLSSCGFRRKKYENPITADTDQPDKVLFDKAIRDIEKGRFEIARLTLQTLINTYDTSEFLAKAKLAVADSWYRTGGSHGMAQAEAEYKDFILFYPTMEEAAEAQQKICTIHYRQMDKADRDPTHAMRAEEECRQLLVQFPNSKFAPQAEQLLRNIQEVLADHEYRVGYFYHQKGSLSAAANRLEALTTHYPLYSQADEALWRLGDSYERMGPKYADRSAEAYARLVREYPLSQYVDDAQAKLRGMERDIPEADPVALARMKYEEANSKAPGMMDKFWGVFKRNPDMSLAAKSGQPSMESFRPSLPVTIPAPGETGGVGGFAGDVSVSTVQDSSALDTLPDARTNPAAGGGEAQQEGGQTATPAPQEQQQTPAQQPNNRTQRRQRGSSKK
jgi:outer membrane protein assembly factor BamD